MKVEKKTNHFQEDADKIQQIPEEKNDGLDGQDKPERSVEELPTPSRNNMEEDFPEPSDINSKEELPTANNEEELPGLSRYNVEFVFPEPTGIISKEELPTAIKEEELPGLSRYNVEFVFSEPTGIISKEELPTAIKEEELPGLSRYNVEFVFPEPTGIISKEELPTANKEEELPGLSRYNVEFVFPEPTGIISKEELPTAIKEEELPGLSRYNVEFVFPEPTGIISKEELPTAIKEEELPGLSRYNVEFVFPEPTGIISKEELPTDNKEEELPAPSSEAKVSSEELEQEDDVEENQNIEPNNVEAELMTDSFVEQAEYQHLNDIQAEYQDLINVIQFHDTQRKILVAHNRIIDQIQSQEDRYIQVYKEENGQQNGEELQSNVEDNEEVKIKEVKEDGESIKDSQEASCKMPGPSRINNESSKDQEKDDDNGENTSIKINEEREEGRAEESSSSSASLEDELDKTTDTSQNGRSDVKPEQAGEASPAATVPLSLRSFTFYQKLGAGSFGEVYLAKDNIHEECVAIKVADKRQFTYAGYSLAERKILKISHKSPHLIHGLATFHTKNFVYYVMEFAPRGDLYSFLCKNRPLEHATIQFITAELICGIQFLHKKGIIHRDLKLENILLSADGHVKIIDFGLAATGVSKKTKGRCVGTLKYMAPEVVRHQKHGKGVDYYAIGVILYRMYMSKSPFRGRYVADVNYAILNYTPKYPDFLTPDTVDLLQGLLHKDQKHRLGVKGDVRKHPYFANINWEDIEAGRALPPAIMTAAPVNQNLNQTLDYEERSNRIRPEDQKIFKGFNFIGQEWDRHYHDDDTLKTKSSMANLFARMSVKKRAN